MLTWKSTAAAPTPIRPGACPLTPWANSPWQLAQSSTNRLRPWAMCAEFAVAGEDADALPLVMTA